MEMESYKDSESNNKILYIGFNQDDSAFSIGTEYGFQIYNSNPFKLIIQRSRTVKIYNNYRFKWRNRIN